MRRVGFDPNDVFARPLVEGQARITAEALAEDRSREGVLRIVDEAHEFADAAAEEASSAIAETSRMVPACAAGCAFCCYGTVFASAPEVLRIAEHLRKSRSSSELDALRARLAEDSARIESMSQESRQAARVPCPLLDVATGRCTVYEVRPFSCRAYNSGDRVACESAFARGEANPVLPMNPLLFSGRHAVSFGMMAGFSHAGLDVGPYELVRGLSDALAHEDATAAWLAGQAPLTHTPVSEEARGGYESTMRALAGDLAGGRMRLLDKHLVRVDPDERRKARNKRKRDKKR